MGKVKKGLTTLSVLLLASAILYLIYSFSMYSNSLKEVNNDIVDFDNTNLCFDSVSYGVKSIMAQGAMNISISGNNISFKKNTSLSTQYAQDILSFNQFISGGCSYGNASMDTTELGRPRAYIMPQNIEVDNFPGRVTFTPQNSTASAGQVMGYSILIRIDAATPTINWTGISILTPSDPHAMYINIGVQGNDGGRSNSTYISKEAFSEVKLLTASNQTLATFQFNSSAQLKAYYATDMVIETIVILNESAHVETRANIINASVSEGITKKGKVMLSES
jgi:hypothetical protein